MIYRARTVVTMTGPPIENGAVAIKRNLIHAVGPFSEVAALCPDMAVEDLGDRVLLPGLINAHCHLDYTMMRHTMGPQRTFTEWIKRINALKRSLDDRDYLDAIALGFADLERWGTTTVLNIESFPELLTKLPPPPIRTWWFYEMIDVRQRIATEELAAGAFQFFQRNAGWLGGFGLSPHSPYTASPDLFRLANACALANGMPLTTHAAESREEEAMFRTASGPLYDFMASLGRPMDDCGKRSSIANLIENGLAGPGWLLAHVNEVSESDFEMLARPELIAEMDIVHCPRSHRYFRHSHFPYRRLHEMGYRISLGTDSLASNSSLSLFTEMQTARQIDPWLTAEDLLKAVTIHPARALNRKLSAGSLRPGALADLIALPYDGAPAEVYDAIVEHRQPIEWMIVNGKPRGT